MTERVTDERAAEWIHIIRLLLADRADLKARNELDQALDTSDDDVRGLSVQQILDRHRADGSGEKIISKALQLLISVRATPPRFCPPASPELVEHIKHLAELVGLKFIPFLDAP